MNRLKNGSGNIEDYICFPHKPKNRNAEVKKVLIILLNGQALEISCQLNTAIKDLLNLVMEYMNIVEREYFSLSYIKDSEHIFLEPEEKLSKISPPAWKADKDKHHIHIPLTFNLFLRIKFYTDDINIITDPKALHQHYLQVRKDVLEQRLVCSDDEIFSLASFALQSEFGDFEALNFGPTSAYFIVEHYVPRRTINKYGIKALKDKLVDGHRKLKGLSRDQAEISFLREAQTLREYGIHFYKVFKCRHKTFMPVHMGISSNGIIIIEDFDVDMAEFRTPIASVPWANVDKISFDQNRFRIQKKFFVNKNSSISQSKLLNREEFYTENCKKGRYLLKLCEMHHKFYLNLKMRKQYSEIYSQKSPARFQDYSLYTDINERLQLIKNRDDVISQMAASPDYHRGVNEAYFESHTLPAPLSSPRHHLYSPMHCTFHPLSYDNRNSNNRPSTNFGDNDALLKNIPPIGMNSLRSNGHVSSNQLRCTLNHYLPSNNVETAVLTNCSCQYCRHHNQNTIEATFYESSMGRDQCGKMMDRRLFKNSRSLNDLTAVRRMPIFCESIKERNKETTINAANERNVIHDRNNSIINSHNVNSDNVSNICNINNSSIERESKQQSSGYGSQRSNYSLDFNLQDDAYPITPNIEKSNQTLESKMHPKIIQNAHLMCHSFDDDNNCKNIEDAQRTLLSNHRHDRLESLDGLVESQNLYNSQLSKFLADNNLPDSLKDYHRIIHSYQNRLNRLDCNIQNVNNNYNNGSNLYQYSNSNHQCNNNTVIGNGLDEGVTPTKNKLTKTLIKSVNVTHSCVQTDAVQDSKKCVYGNPNTNSPLSSPMILNENFPIISYSCDKLDNILSSFATTYPFYLNHRNPEDIDVKSNSGDNICKSVINVESPNSEITEHISGLDTKEMKGLVSSMYNMHSSKANISNKLAYNQEVPEIHSQKFKNNNLTNSLNLPKIHEQVENSTLRIREAFDFLDNQAEEVNQVIENCETFNNLPQDDENNNLPITEYQHYSSIHVDSVINKNVNLNKEMILKGNYLYKNVNEANNDTKNEKFDNTRYVTFFSKTSLDI
ncbi:putative uncharacterized protein DDB_G0282133 [Gordionus sp. m RMFG-2023]|uniref:putative uncharacterized protein DDB_G0282133 n=1 Tax=Gordionus sp. m RMFG-2023 TaxID=3053472 RepID=UPI0031FBE08C